MYNTNLQNLEEHLGEALNQLTKSSRLCLQVFWEGILMRLNLEAQGSGEAGLWTYSRDKVAVKH